MSTFDQRQKGYENQFAHEQEVQFKIIARRNRLIADWAAEQLQLEGSRKEAYILDLLVLDEDDLAQKLVHDFQEEYLEHLIPEINNQIQAAQNQALAEWQSENN